MVPRRFWQGWTRVKGTHAGFGKAVLAKRLVRRKEGVLPRIDWLGASFKRYVKVEGTEDRHFPFTQLVICVYTSEQGSPPPLINT